MLLQMCSYFLFFLLINLLADLPLSSSADDPRFTECSREFECGETRIGYPFYGNDRPEYCGVPGYELGCENDESVRIRIQSEYFNVLDFSETNRTLRIASIDDVGNDSCPTVNISLPADLFTYFEPLTQNINLFYDCSVIELITANRFSCSNDMSSVNYFWIDPIRPPPQEISSCNTTVIVPVMEAVVQSFRPVEEVWREGFVVEYVTDDSFCNDCRGSGGYCGRNWTTSQSTCLCYDGAYPERCPNASPPPAVVSKNNNRRKIGIGVGTGIGSMVVIATLLYCWKRVHISTHSKMLSRKNKKAQMVVEDFLKNYGSLAPKRYNYHDIKKITDSFKNKIGQGGYGIVYKGKLDDGRLVAVKLLEKAKADGEEFMNEHY